MSSGLRVLDQAEVTYFLPDQRVAQVVLNPALSNCERFDLMAGYFSAAVLAEMSHGLAAFILNSQERLRFLISPVLSPEDQQALADGSDPEFVADEFLERVFNDEEALQNALALHSKKCLAFLLSKNRLEMRIVLMRKGLFHPKAWIFAQGSDVAVLSGSANATGSALTANVEQVRLDRSWRGEDSLQACKDMERFFENYWENQRPDVGLSVPVSEAVSDRLLRDYKEEEAPSLSDYQAAVDQVAGVVGGGEVLDDGFKIPAGLEWDRGPFKHQGQAVRAWEENGNQGVLSVATGGGKTICSLVAAHRLAEREGRLFILVVAPTKPLVSQWVREMREFGLRPYQQSEQLNAKQNSTRIDERLLAVELGVARVDSAVITIDLLNSEPLRKVISAYGDFLMLIGDEVHNLGTEKFVATPPNASFRLGLSATPRRQYDPEGTARLMDYFGGVVFQFGLDKAIGLCLVPYDYFVHEANLNHDEMDEYRELSVEIRMAFARLGEYAKDNKSVEQKIFRRRAVLESAAGKISVLKGLLQTIDAPSMHHTLIYATDKNPAQLEAVNRILSDLNIRYHQLTQEETSNANLVQNIVDRFRSGELQVLTAKRVLDEGFNIPEISTAYVLASTTVERQWTQRRGRILRLCQAIGKEKAVLHDVVTLPPLNEPADQDVQRLAQGELKRVLEFANLASNKDSRQGALTWYQKVSSEFGVWVEQGELGD